MLPHSSLPALDKLEQRFAVQVEKLLSVMITSSSSQQLLAISQLKELSVLHSLKLRPPLLPQERSSTYLKDSTVSTLLPLRLLLAKLAPLPMVLSARLPFGLLTQPIL